MRNSSRSLLGTTHEALAGFPIFRQLSPVALRRLANVSEVRTFERSETVFEEGERAAALVTVLSGRIKIFQRTPVGRNLILEVAGPGETAGAVAAYEGRPYQASAMALEPTRCLFTPRRDFGLLLEHSPILLRGVLSGLDRKLGEMTSRLCQASTSSVEARFARLFLRFANDVGRLDRGGTFIPLKLTRQELADLTGTTVETAIRIMSRWQRLHLLHTETDGFVVMSRQGLAAQAIARRPTRPPRREAAFVVSHGAGEAV